MANRENFKLLYIFNNGKKVQAFNCDLPNPDSASIQIRIQGPKTLDPAHGRRIPTALKPSIPVYDTQTDEVVWSCGGQTEALIVDAKWLDVWRISRHLEVGDVDGVPCKPVWPSTSTSVTLEGGFASVSVPVDYSNRNYTTLNIWQKKDGKDWALAEPFDNADSVSDYHQLISAEKDSGVEYVYQLAATHADARDYYSLFSINSTRFRNLAKDKTSRWTKYELKTNLYFRTNAQNPVYVITHDTVTGSGKHKILLFQLRNASAAIDVATIALRKDGSVDTNADIVDTGTTRIKLPAGVDDPTSQNLNAFVFKDGQKNYIFLTWQRNKDMIGLIGATNDDGGITDNTSWKTVQIIFENPIGLNAGAYAMSGVVVPKEFF